MEEDEIGAIVLYQGTEIPVGWKLCNGETLANASYPELYAVIGTKYGGDDTNFKVPDGVVSDIANYIIRVS